MKQTIEIEVPDGKKAIWKDNKVVFEDIKPQLPKTWEEFCVQNMIKKDEYYLDASSCVTETLDNERNIYTDRNVLPNKQAAEAHLALMQLHQLRDCYRQGWVPDWNSNQDKFAIMKSEDEFLIVHGYCISRFIAFQDEKRAKEFLKCFRDLIEKVGDLI